MRFYDTLGSAFIRFYDTLGSTFMRFYLRTVDVDYLRVWSRMPRVI